MSKKEIVYVHDGIEYKAQEGARTVNLYNGPHNFTNFAVNSDIEGYDHLRNIVLEWLAINNIHTKIADWLELCALDEFVNDGYIEQLERMDGFRELEILANVTNIKRIGPSIRIIANRNGEKRYFETDRHGKVVG